MHKFLLALLIIPTIILAETEEDYSSGRVRLSNIMSNEETGVAAYNKKYLKFAETRNLTNDLNIAQMAAFFECKTLMGESFIAETLKYPLGLKGENPILTNRQDAIKALVENPNLKKEVEQLLMLAKQAEQQVIQLMSDIFIGKSCPELQQLELIKRDYPFLYPINNFFIKSPNARTISNVFNYLAFVSLLSFTVISAVNKFVFGGVYFGCLSALSLYGIYHDYATACEKRSKLHSLNKLINISEKIEKLCVRHDIKKQFKMADIDNLKGIELVQKLKHSRYKSKHSTFFSTAAVHTLLYEVYEQDKNLAPIFTIIAEMDAYNAIANKILESQSQKNKFCFVEFIENAKPTIKATGFWNILVQDAVTNNIAETKNIILTGANKGGKSTAIRALLQNIVLAQSFGIAAAQSLKITPYDVIHSFINISDDILNGTSLFSAEVKRAQEILQKIKSLEPNCKYFFALDELFTGTAAEEGEKCAYEFVKRISEFKDIQFIYATHFNKLKDLGKDNQFCINYKVDAPIKNNEGKLVYPFTLSQGYNDINVAMDLAREADLFA
ncbi:MAG: hypothetical protein P4L22_06655 [Candidatus Babeliales bacterium]|nr:hypothetical protein [Candidatus Babeliales bacterium]